MTLTVYKIFLKLYEFHKNQCLIYKYYSHHPLIYVGEKKNPLPKFMLLNRLWLNPQSCDMKLSFFYCSLFSLFPLDPQVFEERSLCPGGGDLPLRHRHWPLCESHRSPGQHCCISTQRPGGSAYHRRSRRLVMPIRADHVYEQPPSAAGLGRMWYHVISAWSRRLVLPEMPRWGGGLQSTRCGVYVIPFLVL